MAQSVERRIGNAEVGGSIPLGSFSESADGRLEAGFANNQISGCGSVWLERRVRDAEAASSNLVTPTDVKIANSKGLAIFLPCYIKRAQAPVRCVILQCDVRLQFFLGNAG